MAKIAAKSGRYYLDQYHLSGNLTSADMGIIQEGLVVNTFLDEGPRRIVGNYDHTATFNGLFDAVAADTDFDRRIFVPSWTDADHYLMQGFAGDAEGAICYEQIVHLIEQPRVAQVGQAALLNFSAEGRGHLCRSTVLANVTATGTTQRPGQNTGASVLGSLYQAVVRLISFTGTTITISIQQSSDNASGDPYTDVMNTVMTEAGVARLTTTAATEAWKRVSFTGTFSSATVLVTAGFVG